jgi:hemerythrin-like domain-containing protein
MGGTMEATETFRIQHDELVVIAKDIAGNLKADALRTDAKSVRLQLSKMAGVLGAHLSIEDRWLYPKLVAHTDASVARLAREYQDEMSGLKEAFDAYMTRWETSQKIQANPETFIKETLGIFEVLSQRIHRENSELYTLVDRLGLESLA